MKSSTNISIIPKLLLVFGLFAQVVCIFLIGDKKLIPEWSIYLDSLLQFGTFSYNWTEWNTGWVPSAYAPPLYPIFLWLLVSVIQPQAKFVNEISIFSIRIIELVQVGLWIITTYFIYLITNIITANKRIGLWATSLFILFPLSIVMPSQISAVNIYILFLTLLLYYIIKIGYESSNGKEIELSAIFITGMITICLLFSRNETLLYVPIVVIFFCIKGSWKKAILYLSIVMVFITAFLIRNYNVFNQSTFISTSTGYNLWRGHNETAGSDGIGYLSNDLINNIKNISIGDDFEVRQNQVYMNEAIQYIKAKPLQLIYSSIDKIIALWLFEADPGDETTDYVLSIFYWGVMVYIFRISNMGDYFNTRKGFKLSEHLIHRSYFYFNSIFCCTALPFTHFTRNCCLLSNCHRLYIWKAWLSQKV